MKTVKICLHCRTPLPADAPAGLCPECLLKSEVPTLSGAAPDSAHSIHSNEPRRAPVPGEEFGGYRIERLLGRGGMGEVYEAEQLATNRRVALKVMNQTLASEPDRKRFLREGRLAASVSHQNVVYIYGSEEIAGSPVIVMELVPSGTLKDRIKRQGPLPVAEAVDAILHIIAGLEAAQTTGVLHRDIKPANCFIGADGTIKVGDFGLSISTIARGESLVTTTGSVLGTPAYASPEQLRGEDLAVTADIYSVGATLYHMVTGRPPHETVDFIKLITEVLDKTPLSPDRVQPRVPAGLAKVIMRCLAKEPAARFPSYSALRQALLPFSSVAPSAALLGLRFVAGFVDEIFAYLPALLLLVWTGHDALQKLAIDRTTIAALMAIVILLWDLLYYAIPEGLWGAAVGKAICGLRVVGPSRGSTGLPRAALRALIFRSTTLVPALLTLLLYSGPEYLARVNAEQWMLEDWLWFPLLAFLFCSMRRRNGYAGLHDLVSGTRVVARPVNQQRPLLREHAASPTVASSPHAIGPYEVRASLGMTSHGELLLAHDAALRRDLWILRTLPATPALSVRRRDLSRATRLRWLNGDRDGDQGWDAYEALSGVPLLNLPDQPWATVRFWLHDLATEYLMAGQNPSEAAPLRPDHIWITAQNQAVLLDFRCPGLKPETPSIGSAAASPDDFGVAQKFLHDVSEGVLRPSAGQGARPLPQHAQRFLRSLGEAKFESPEFMAGNLHSLLNKPADVSRRRRLATLALAVGPALLVAVCVGVTLWFANKRAEHRWPAQFAGGAELRDELRAYDAFRDQPSAAGSGLGAGPITDDPEKRFRRAFKVHLAAHHRALIEDTNFWAHPVVAEALSADLRRAAEEAVADFPTINPATLAEADATLQLLQPTIRAVDETVPEWTALSAFWSLLLITAVLDLACVLVLGEALIFRLLGIATVTRAGGRASRPRLIGRTLLAWIPLMLGAAISLMAWLSWMPGLEASAPKITQLITILGLVLLGIVAATAWKPARSLADRLTGTWLVPR